jgi:hypothetical protein
MKIDLGGKVFESLGKPVIEGNITKTYATDELKKIYLLMWRTGEEPKQENLSIMVIENPLLY